MSDVVNSGGSAVVGDERGGPIGVVVERGKPAKEWTRAPCRNVSGTEIVPDARCEFTCNLAGLYEFTRA